MSRIFSLFHSSCSPPARRVHCIRMACAPHMHETMDEWVPFELLRFLYEFHMSAGTVWTMFSSCHNRNNWRSNRPLLRSMCDGRSTVGSSIFHCLAMNWIGMQSRKWIGVCIACKTIGRTREHGRSKATERKFNLIAALVYIFLAKIGCVISHTKWQSRFIAHGIAAHVKYVFSLGAINHMHPIHECAYAHTYTQS